MKYWPFFTLLFVLPMFYVYGVVDVGEVVQWGHLTWRGWLMIAIFAGVFGALVWEILPADITVLLGAGALVVTGIIAPQEFVSCFFRDIIATLAMLFIVARTLEINGVLNLFAQLALPSKGSYRRQLLVIMGPLAGLSAFLNNTPLVLMMVPVIRRWAHDHKRVLSKFLIPISYATILGGACTLIGTSTNLVVDGMLRRIDPNAGFAFFELALVGLPALIVGFLYIGSFGLYSLPERSDPTEALREQTRQFTSEFEVTENCLLVGKTVHEAIRRYFQGDLLIEIERGATLLVQPDPAEVIHEGDRLVFAGEIAQIAKLHTIAGLTPTADPHFRLDVASPHFSEVVVAPTSSLIGKTLRRSYFRSQYGATVMAIYRQGRRIQGRIGDIVLRPGDTLMLLGSQPHPRERYFGNEFYVIRHEEDLPIFRPYCAILSVGILLAMVVAATLGVPMLYASTGAALLMVLCGAMRLRQAVAAIEWNLLLLIASAFALGRGLVDTGVADLLADMLLLVVGSDPTLLIGAIFLVTMITTEVITNNAAALIVFPIAAEVAILAGYQGAVALKAVGVTVALAASYSFLTPIGYQTNTIVYGPGGYRFYDYARFGLPLSLLMLLLAALLIPQIWPLSNG